jgi:FtsP/CotA-like multicopper oxidase with cupredoxin domain
MEGMEMTSHCDTKIPAASTANDQFAPVTPSAGGNVIRYRLEAAEIEWEIAPGRTVRGYGFNGQVPGPVLEAKQGVALEIEFTNRLPEPTVIHWHGLRIPAAMDGTEIAEADILRGCSSTTSLPRTTSPMQLQPR